MWWTNVFAVLFVIAVIFCMLYIIVDRICRCCENCSIAKAYGNFASKGGGIEDMFAAVDRIKKMKEGATK